METLLEINGNKVRLKVSPYHARNSLGYYRNIIFDSFSKVGIENKYLEVSYGGGAGIIKSAWAKVDWDVNGETYSYRCDSQKSDIDNLAAISQVIAQDSKAIRRGLKSFGMVMNQFKIGFDPSTKEKIMTPREILGIPEHIKDLDYIEFKYKQKAKVIHPDAGGDAEEFKKLNEAMEQLKKELGE